MSAAGLMEGDCQWELVFLLNAEEQICIAHQSNGYYTEYSGLAEMQVLEQNHTMLSRNRSHWVNSVTVPSTFRVYKALPGYGSYPTHWKTSTSSCNWLISLFFVCTKQVCKNQRSHRVLLGRIDRSFGTCCSG